jgi:hypothetical protein
VYFLSVRPGYRCFHLPADPLRGKLNCARPGRGTRSL